MSARDLFSKIAEIRSEYRANKKINKDARAYEVVSRLIPEELQTIAGEMSDLKFHGSTGLGNITAALWIATFDTRLTSSAT